MARATEVKTEEKIMAAREFSDMCAAEIEKRKLFEGAKAFADAFLLKQKELEKATRERDEALAEKAVVEKDIATWKARLEQETAAALAVTEAACVKREKESAAELKRLEDETKQTRVRVEDLRRTLALLEEQLEGARKRVVREEATLNARVDALKKQEQEIRDRLKAVLGP